MSAHIEVGQFVGLDILTHASDYLADQFEPDLDCRANFDAREILFRAMSRLLDTVEVPK